MEKNHGFTLVELAIVLVIIGIIIGTIIKGQDLILSAKTKKFMNIIKEWEISQWIFQDRFGRFAGDRDSDGVIDDVYVKDDLTSLNLAYPPWSDKDNTISLGDLVSFKVSFGYYNASGVLKNVMEIWIPADVWPGPVCRASSLNSYLKKMKIAGKYGQALDVAIDGGVGVKDGKVLCVNKCVNVSNPPYTSLWDQQWFLPISYPQNLTLCDTWDNATMIIYFFDASL